MDYFVFLQQSCLVVQVSTKRRERMKIIFVREGETTLHCSSICLMHSVALIRVALKFKELCWETLRFDLSSARDIIEILWLLIGLSDIYHAEWPCMKLLRIKIKFFRTTLLIKLIN